MQSLLRQESKILSAKHYYRIFVNAYSVPQKNSFFVSQKNILNPYDDI